MKKILGKFLLLLSFITFSMAEDFIYTLKVSNKMPYNKEALFLTLDINQTNHDIVLLFNFDLQKSQSYTFQRIEEKTIDENHHNQFHYVYIIYPLKKGEIAIKLNLEKRVTTDDNIAYSFSGDRDNVKGITTVNTMIHLPNPILKVQPLPQDVKVVGDFKLTYQIKKYRAKRYEPLPMQIILKGEGYPPILEHILPDDLNITIFKDIPLVETKSSLRGSETKVTYALALSHHKSFILPPKEIKAFNPKINKIYTLKIPKQHFTITPPDTKALLDKRDNPKPLKIDFSWITTLLSSLLLFIAGYLTAISVKWQYKKKIVIKNPLLLKIEEAKDEKALFLILLTLSFAQKKRIRASIKELEDAIDKKESVDIKRVKKTVLTALKI